MKMSSGRSVGKEAGREIDETQHSSDGAVVRLLSFQAHVETDCGQALEDLVSLYPACTNEHHLEGTVPGARFALKEYNRGGRQPVYLLRGEGGRVDFFDTSRDAVAYLDHLLSMAAVRHLGSHMLVHAGSVALDREGILIPGESGVGKSTLVAGLSLSGYSYLSDELAVIEIGTAALLPFLKPICLKRGGWQALDHHVGAPATVVNARRIDGEVVSYFAAPERGVVEEPTPVRFVLLPDRVPGADPELSECSRSRALVELARNSLNLPSHGPQGIESLARLVEGAECFVLRYDDLSTAIEMISGLVGQAAETEIDNESAVPVPAHSDAA